MAAVAPSALTEQTRATPHCLRPINVVFGSGRATGAAARRSRTRLAPCTERKPPSPVMGALYMGDIACGPPHLFNG
jgi:hypothetical protein